MIFLFIFSNHLHFCVFTMVDIIFHQVLLINCRYFKVFNHKFSARAGLQINGEVIPFPSPYLKFDNMVAEI